MKKLILPLTISILLSAVSTYFLLMWFSGYAIDSSVKLSINYGQIFKLFITSLIFFLMLITLPFLAHNVARWLDLKKSDWWKSFLFLEAFITVFSYFSTPPDLISTILFISICQPIVLVNLIVLNRKLSGNN
ncbi:MAG: uncharacterized membrane protein YhaH (DUF805 family) [Parvicellaceae bacterium]|jgi:uncharacterized membrane protein YhaH (DUF805 family)